MALPQTSSKTPDIKKQLPNNTEQAFPEVMQEVTETTLNQESVKIVTDRETGENSSASNTDAEQLNVIRSGSLTQLSVPSDPVDNKTLADIKKHLFPTIDFEKTNPTPQELVNYLLLNHSMKLEQAHDWIEFLASNSEAKA